MTREDRLAATQLDGQVVDCGRGFAEPDGHDPDLARMGGHIADREDTGDGGSHPLVDDDVSRLQFHTPGCQRAEVRCEAERGDQCPSWQQVFDTVAAPYGYGFELAFTVSGYHLGIENDAGSCLLQLADRPRVGTDGPAPVHDGQ